MAFVEVHMIAGRSLEQKASLTKAIAEALVTYANAAPEYLHVVISEYPKDNWARAGVLLSEL